MKHGVCGSVVWVNMFKMMPFTATVTIGLLMFNVVYTRKHTSNNGTKESY